MDEGTVRYRKLVEIGAGQGRHSKVYKAEDLHRGGIIAVKEIPKADFSVPIDGLFSEARAMFAASHPTNVVPIHWACERANEKLVCIGMPLYKESLQDRVNKGPLTPGEVIKVGLDILGGLQQLHSNQYIHFDIKCSNVLFNDKDEAIIADFGQTRPIGLNGTTGWPQMYCWGVPPEWFTNAVGTVKADIFQTAATLYRALNGDAFYMAQRPTDSNALRAKILAGKFPNPKAFLPHVPRSLKRVIRKALKLDPAERFASAPDFQDALARVRIKHDWKIALSANGEDSWRAARINQPDLLVQLVNDGGHWSVQDYTDNNGHRRARSPEKWPRHLTRTQAMSHLDLLFHSLE
jgi:serine/threonine protein kinase